MLKILIITKRAYVIELENMVENFALPSLDETIEFKNPKSSTQVVLAHGCHSLMLLPRLFAQKTIGTVPLVDYFQGHVVSSKTYLRIMGQKAVDRESTK
jgi:hypothetical protein